MIKPPFSRLQKILAGIASIMVILTSCLLFLRAQDIPELPREESKFTFGRIFYEVPLTRGRRGGMGWMSGPPWSHDWPRLGEHLMKIMAEVTKLDVNPGGHIINFQNDDCFKYPVAYLCEVGYMNLSDEEAQRMREYLLRGGFLIVDDFRREYELWNFEDQLKKVFPDRSLEELPRTHQIWKCFYDISNIPIKPPPIYDQSLVPQYFGIHDDHDRLMMVVNYNNDIGEYVEFSDDPYMPFDETNQAYKYFVNYVMYALTH